MDSRRKKIFLFLSIFFFLLIFDPAAYVQCTNLMPDQIMDVLSVAKHENTLVEESKIKLLKAGEILDQQGISAVSWQEYYMQTLAGPFPMPGIVTWGIRAIKKKEFGVLKLGDDPDSFTINDPFDIRKVQFFNKYRQAPSSPLISILRI